MVYHYTTLESFYNMLSAYKAAEDKDYLLFWASNALNQNDSKELSLRTDDIISVIKRIENELNDNSTYLKKLSIIKELAFVESLSGQEIKNTLDESFRTIKNAPYTVSFSRNRDQMVMWAMYANNGNGICLAFDENKLKCQQPSSYSVSDDVIYDSNPIYYYDVIRAFYEMYHNEVNDEYILQGFYARKIKYLAAMLWTISPFIKDKAFRDEAEYRIAYLPISNDNQQVFTRLTNRMNVINYIKVKVPLAALKYIVIGPCANYRKAKTLLVENMKSCNIEKDYSNGFIRKSKVPYRIY